MPASLCAITQGSNARQQCWALLPHPTAGRAGTGTPSPQHRALPWDSGVGLRMSATFWQDYPGPVAPAGLSPLFAEMGRTSRGIHSGVVGESQPHPWALTQHLKAGTKHLPSPLPAPGAAARLVASGVLRKAAAPGELGFCRPDSASLDRQRMCCYGGKLGTGAPESPRCNGPSTNALTPQCRLKVT